MAGKKKLDIEFIRHSFENSGYELLVDDYKNCDQLLDYRCPKGHLHRINWSNWKKGVRCPYCDGQGKPDINIIREFFDACGYKLLDTEYINDSGKLLYECPVGHVHSMRWGNFRNGKRCPSCDRIKNSLNKSGNKHYNWMGGKTFEPYGQIWTNNKFKSLIKYRDKYKCQNPDCYNKSSRLTIHHIDYNKKNCDSHNLITLCNSCNVRANSNRNYWKELYNNIIQEKNDGINSIISLYKERYSKVKLI
jgi:hypothetical protein